MPASILSRAFRYFLITLSTVVSLITIAFGLLWWISRPPSDASMEEKFVAHRADLERLVAMIEEDPQMVRIADDFTWKDDDFSWPRPESNWGISGKRWDQYRALFRNIDLDAGIVRGAKSRDTQFIVWTYGLVTGGASMSFIYCGTPTKDYSERDDVCTTNKSSGSFSIKEHDVRYKKLAESWYLEYEED